MNVNCRVVIQKHQAEGKVVFQLYVYDFCSPLASCLNYAWKLEYWYIEYLIFILWVRSFSTRLTSVTFAEDKVLIFLILRKNAKIVQLLSLILILTLISRADWSDKLEWYIVERYVVF